MTRKTLLSVALVAMLGLAMSAIAAQVGSRQGMLDPNMAGEKELLALPHLNATIAKAMIQRRPFLSMADLNAFLLQQGLTKEQLPELYGRMFLHLNLNTATKEEILLIPNLGNRMVREFLEYRPYKALAQFRREMGKYVDAKEVARLEQYVFVPINLNTATDEEILTIPGLGKRLLNEFKEYRPYKSIEQFRREIGKYVDEKEVARLERYVTVD